MFKKIFILLVVFGIGAAAGRLAGPTKVVEKEHIVYQDKIVEKVVKVTDTKRKDNRTYDRIVTISPDGTKKTETKITNQDVVTTKDSTNLKKDEDSTTTTTKEKTTDYAKQSTLISIGAKNAINTPLSPPSYGLLVNQRVLGPMYLGGFVFTDQTIGLNIGVGF